MQNCNRRSCQAAEYEYPILFCCCWLSQVLTPAADLDNELFDFLYISIRYSSINVRALYANSRYFYLFVCFNTCQVVLISMRTVRGNDVSAPTTKNPFVSSISLTSCATFVIKDGDRNPRRGEGEGAY